MNNLGVDQLFVSPPNTPLGSAGDVIISNPNGSELIISKTIAIGTPENKLATIQQVKDEVEVQIKDKVKVQVKNEIELQINDSLADVKQLKLDVSRLVILLNGLLIPRN